MSKPVDDTPEPLPFPMPDANDAPSKATDVAWIAWRVALGDARSERNENARLQEELRNADSEREALGERIRSLEHHKRIIVAISTLLEVLGSLFGAAAFSIAMKNEPEKELAMLVGVFGAALLVAGIAVKFIPDSRRRKNSATQTIQ